MSTTIQITADQVPQMLRKEAEKMRGALEKAAKSAAKKLQRYLAQRSDELGITDRGIYKRGFKAIGNTVINDAPHAGIVELGARPHKVSLAGVEAIAGWVRRKLRNVEKPNKSGKPSKFSKDEAMEIAWAIAKKIEKFGQAPRYVMRDAVPKATAFYVEDLKKILEAGK